MLRQQTEETPTLPAAQARVTPEELAQALSRIEARKDAGQRHVDGTIPLGDAVQELGLNATPEELLREIEVGRARSQESLARTHQHQSNRRRIGGVLFLVLSLCGGVFAGLRTSAPPPTIVLDPNLLVEDASQKITMLSEVPDGRPVLCGLSIADADTFAKFVNFVPSGVHWTLIKHSGKVYIRGWISGDMSDAAFRSTNVYLYPTHQSDQDVTSSLQATPVTLPLDSYESSDEVSITDETICGSHIIPDGYFKEKWRP